jgi:hypothetical protein
MVAYQRPMPGGAMPTPNPGRDALTMALMNNSTPPPGGPGIPPGMTGAAPPFGGIAGGPGPAASLAPPMPPMGPMGAVGGPAQPGLGGLPLGVGMTPGQLPQAMNPMAAAGGVPPPQGTNPLQRPAMPGGRAY